MNSLITERVAQTLEKLHRDAEAADRDFMNEVMAGANASEGALDHMIATLIDAERADYRAQYRNHAEHFLAVSPAYGRFIYALARVRNCEWTESGWRVGVELLNSLG